MSYHNHPILVLNDLWQAIRVGEVEAILTDMAKGTIVGLDIRRPLNGNGEYDLNNDKAQPNPVSWEEWLTLEVRKGLDSCIHSAKYKIRLPNVVVTVNNRKMPKKRLKLNRDGVYARDGGKDGYTGEDLKKEDMDIDHIIPRSRGGKHEWTNVISTHKKRNRAKDNKTPAEAGLKLHLKPHEPPALPATLFIKSLHLDWDLFLH